MSTLLFCNANTILAEDELFFSWCTFQEHLSLSFLVVPGLVFLALLISALVL